MSKLQRILCMVLSAVLLLAWMPASLAEENAEEEIQFPDELIVGHPTITKGDFFTELFGNNTADIDVRALIHGYNLVNWDQNQGTYVFDPSVVTAVTETVDEFGDHRYSLVLAEDLFYSDGSPITAWDYAFSLLLMMSPEIEEIGGKIYRAEHILGYDDYIANRRAVLAGQEPTTVDYLSGVHVIGDYQLEFILDHNFLPYFFETGLLLTVPYPIKVIAPGCKVTHGYVDAQGNTIGIKIVNEDQNNLTPIFTAELLKQTILDPQTGYNTFPSVCSGPYVIKSWDGVTGHFEINEYFKGAWVENNLPGGEVSAAIQRAMDRGFVETVEANDGTQILLVKPSIEKIAFTVADNDTMITDLANGDLHLVNKVTYGKTIVEGTAYINDAEKEGVGLQYQNYPRIGLSFLTFTYDWPTVHEMEVRQAIAWCMDRDFLTNKYCGYENSSYGMRMDGYFGIEQWEYKLVTGRMSFPVNFLPTRDALGTPIKYEGPEKEKMDKLLKLKNRYFMDDDQEGYERAIAAWEGLVEEWKDKLTVYTVDLDKANALLEGAKWNLNRNGEPYQAGVDDVRCKMVDDHLVALDLKMLYPAGNHMAEIMRDEGKDEFVNEEKGWTKNFVDNLAKVGIKLELVPAPMEELLRAYYREADRTTDMIYLATNFHVIVDPSITYSTDDSVGHKVWNNTYSDDEQLYWDAVDMRKTEPGDYYEYVAKWMSFQKRYNEVLPTIPIYSNIYYDFFTEYLQNYEITSSVTWSQAILLAYFGLPEAEPEVEEEPLAEGEVAFDD